MEPLLTKLCSRVARIKSLQASSIKDSKPTSKVMMPLCCSTQRDSSSFRRITLAWRRSILPTRKSSSSNGSSWSTSANSRSKPKKKRLSKSKESVSREKPRREPTKVGVGKTSASKVRAQVVTSIPRSVRDFLPTCSTRNEARMSIKTFKSIKSLTFQPSS